MHSCLTQQGVSVKRRHDALKLALAELARSCGYHVEVEPRFPSRVEYRLNAQTGRFERWAIQEQEHGDLLLVRHGTRQLIDVTVVRPTTLTLLQRGTAATGSHMKPLVAADDAERLKLAKNTAECQRAGWTMVPFALESYSANGQIGHAAAPAHGGALAGQVVRGVPRARRPRAERGAAGRKCWHCRSGNC